MTMTTPTFEETAKDEPGKIYEDSMENGVRYLIMRGPSSINAYMGVPQNHPLWGFDYDSIPLDVHGGLTYASEGKGHWPAGWWWYGWDYAHAGDDVFYYLDGKTPAILRGEQWTVEKIRGEIWNVTYDFSKLMRLAERIMTSPKAASKERTK